MLSEDSIKKISSIFCGDIGDFYTYKKGPQLVRFFNQYFGSEDVYQSGFPSRWVYVYNKLVDMLNHDSVDKFFNIILSKEYLMRDSGITEVQAVEKETQILCEINNIVGQDLCALTQKNGRFHLIKENDDLVLVGNGGFANVYRQKSTGLIVKKLKDDFLTDPSIRSRFKREFDITKSLDGDFGIIQVYTFDEGKCSYTMELAETTLEDYILRNHLPDTSKLNCIRQILHIMTNVHQKDIIHRDISPNNIFIISGMLKIADFGLGKDLNVFTSHQTLHTNAVGQYFYCAPEQFMMLKDADKRSDVYSLGRVINFIMTGDPQNSHHIYTSVAQKATNSDAAYRYADAGQLSLFFEKSVEFHNRANRQESIDQKIQKHQYDTDVESYIYDMGSEEIAKALRAEKRGFAEALICFMHANEGQAQHIIQSIEQSFREVCSKSFEANDPFASFSARVLKDDFSFAVKETAATILRYVAWDVNRFRAQRMVEDLVLSGIDPMLEEIISQ